MISLPAGTFAMFVVFLYATQQANLGALINTHALVLVFAGSAAVFALSTPWPNICSVFTVFHRLIVRELPKEAISSALLSLSVNRRSKVTDNHPLVVYAQQLWEGGVDREMFSTLLTEKMVELNGATERAAATLRNLAKYPPPLGMTGTVIGLIRLFANLTQDARANIGPSLALAMTATLYGLILANAVLMPLADRVFVIHLQEVRKNEAIYHVLKLIHSGEAETLIRGELHAVAA